MEYRDFSFNKSISNTSEELKGINAIIKAIKIILLSVPGNFPYRPNLGMNIGKYLFSYMDDETINMIETELNNQISLYLPSISSLNIKIDSIEAEGYEQGLGILIQSYIDSKSFTTSFSFLKNNETIDIINEIF